MKALQAENERLQQLLEKTQHQLLLQEKMAAIGLLSAGIAHEIKNPLNLINNFSEMTVELTQELKTEFTKMSELSNPKQLQTIEKMIEDISTNCKKITEHGKRAESIIKNMLIQARTAEVDKTLVNINGLLEEFLNLAYHGMRAQHHDFNVKLEKHFDQNLKPLTASSQSIGRVFLNIINNAMYAANEKAHKTDKNFIPTITITTIDNDKEVTIKIKDNGIGIPENLREKIFEPFFTTKPADSGTGLGLPICYDLIVKEHAGKLEVNSQVGEFTEFIIKLPKNDRK